jgi:large subunit ribosomal protein L10
MHQIFERTSSVVVTRYSGMTVAELSELRRRMREAGASFRVAKNRITWRALKDTRYEKLTPLFKGPTAIAYADDAVSAAKAALAYAKLNTKLVLVGGGIGDVVLDAKGVAALATLPSLDELRGKLVGLLKTPATQLAAITMAPAAKLARVLGAYAAKDSAA